MATQPPSERTRVRRKSERASYEQATIRTILDEGLVCHVGFVIDGQPYVIPTAYGRVGDQLYIHGSAASRMARTLAGGVPVCVTVTLLDGVVLARAARRHSMNYRSVVVLGTAAEVVDPEERLAALAAIVDHALAGRWREVRPPTERELRETAVLRLPLTEASAKIRTGPPVDDADDLTHRCWAGEIPLRLVARPPVPDPCLAAGIAAPAAVTGYQRTKPTYEDT
jgi:nitroimidazol reductase NimA-like FMN-containing flavoprotein (pyridoxamine 5'-phosphate oxidase superfamily)